MPKAHPPATAVSAVPQTGEIAARIFHIRGVRVMLSSDLAQLYGVEPRALMQQVQRNVERFPADFMFQLDAEEFSNLKSQIVTSSLKSQFVISNRGGVRRLPYAFTEQGVAMLSGVLRSPQAIAVNIHIMRTFVALRGMLAEHAELKQKLTELEEKYDDRFRVVFEAIHQLMEEPAKEAYASRRIGFTKDS